MAYSMSNSLILGVEAGNDTFSLMPILTGEAREDVLP